MRGMAVLLAGVACSTALGACASEGDRDVFPGVGAARRCRAGARHGAGLRARGAHRALRDHERRSPARVRSPRESRRRRHRRRLAPERAHYFPSLTEEEATPTPSISQELRAQGIAIVERTEAVAVNAGSGQIFAQPRTLRIDGAGVAGSELFVFDTSGGQPTATRRFERTEFVAGGAAFVFQTSLVLGSGSSLYISEGWADDVRRIASVPGASDITGMASLPSGNLLVLDGPGKRLIELDAVAIGDAASGS
jgi:hypothetical protein